MRLTLTKVLSEDLGGKRTDDEGGAGVGTWGGVQFLFCWVPGKWLTLLSAFLKEPETQAWSRK